MTYSDIVKCGCGSVAIGVAILLAGCGVAPAPDAPRSDYAILALTDETFDREALDNVDPTLVLFSAEWCQVCVATKPSFEELAEEYSGRITFAQLDIEQNSFTAQKYEAESVPTFLLFKRGELVERLRGGRTRAELKQMLESMLSNTARPATAE